MPGFYRTHVGAVRLREGLSDREIARRREALFRLLETLEIVVLTRPVLSRAS